VVLSGSHDHAIDEKGRISLPVRFRKSFETDGVKFPYITNHVFAGERCLALYPRDQWLRVLDQIETQDPFDPKTQRFLNYYISGAFEVEQDKQGRILIPPALREYAGLDREVTLSGALYHVQLWDRERFRRVRQANETELIARTEGFARFGG
jgi:MraZ protein